MAKEARPAGSNFLFSLLVFAIDLVYNHYGLPRGPGNKRSTM